jgi:hypothetical protein
VLITEKIVAERWNVGQCLKNAIHKARVAKIDQTPEADDRRVSQLEKLRGRVVAFLSLKFFTCGDLLEDFDRLLVRLPVRKFTLFLVK